MDNSVVRSFALFKSATDCTDRWSVLSLNSVVSEQYAFGAALSLGSAPSGRVGNSWLLRLIWMESPPQLGAPAVHRVPFPLLLPICSQTPYSSFSSSLYVDALLLILVPPRWTCVDHSSLRNLLVVGEYVCLELRSRDPMMMI